MKIFSSYFVDLLVLMGVALSTILFLPVTPPQIETFSFAAKKFFSDLQNFSTRNSPSVFPYLVKLNGNGSYRGLREPIRKPENHYPELKIYYIYIYIYIYIYMYLSSVKCLPNEKLPVRGSKDTMASPNFINLCNGRGRRPTLDSSGFNKTTFRLFSLPCSLALLSLKKI